METMVMDLLLGCNVAQLKWLVCNVPSQMWLFPNVPQIMGLHGAKEGDNHGCKEGRVNMEYNHFEGEIALYKNAWVTFVEMHICEGGKF